MKNSADGVNQRKLSTPQKLLILFIAILIVFGSINAYWYFGYRSIYNKLADRMDATYGDNGDVEDRIMMRYTKIVGDYSFTLKMPAYLCEGGFLSVGDKEGAIAEIDENGNVINSNGLCISLYIWPQYFGDYKLGIDFYDEAEDIWEQVAVDSHLNIISSEDLDDQYVKYIQDLISDNEDEIKALIDAAQEFWDIQL
jgi:hypothetical protein